MPFGSSARVSKRTLYRIAAPFLRFWFASVEANLTRLEAREIDTVLGAILAELDKHVASVWEELARASVARLELHGRQWKTAWPWWGPGLDRRPLEIDIVAESVDGKAILLGEAKWSSGRQARAAAAELVSKARTFPLAAGRKVHTALWLRESAGRKKPEIRIVTPTDVLRVLR